MIRDIEPWKMQDWSLYYFFPGARSGDLKRFLNPGNLKTILSDIGFKKIDVNFQITHGNEYETVDKWFKIMQNRTHSQLHIISDKEYQDGIKRISDLFLNKRKELEEIISNDCSVIIEVKAIK